MSVELGTILSFPLFGQMLSRTAHTTGTLPSNCNTNTFTSLTSRQALIKYGYHIHALTCSATAMPLLLTFKFENLLEINFVVTEYDREIPPLGLDDLSKLVAFCPRLCAVSIEGLDFAFTDELQAVQALVDDLDRFPSITCLVLSFESSEWGFSSDIGRAIMEERIARVNLAKVKSLSVKDRSDMTRPNRELSSATGRGRQRQWPGRERPLTEDLDYDHPPKILHYDSGGRWDLEDMRATKKVHRSSWLYWRTMEY